MEDLARLEEKVNLICEAYEALDGVVVELNLHYIKELTEALEKLTQIRVEIEEEDIPQAKEAAAKEADAELKELHSTYRWQQGF